MANIKKRSVQLSGRPNQTSFSLEDEFYAALKNIARRQQKTIVELVASIDSHRNKKEDNLSSAIRVFVLKDAQAFAASNAGSDIPDDLIESLAGTGGSNASA